MTVVIVGRPNVGKSTLFNRLIGKRRSITLDTPGVTRDPIVEDLVWDDVPIRLVDTGGLGGEAVIDLGERVHEHTLASVRGADLVVALLDARAGLTPLDRETVALLQKLALPVLYVANKADGQREQDGLVDFCRLGIEAPIGVSAEHGLGIGELRSAIVERVAALRADCAATTEPAPGDDEMGHESGTIEPTDSRTICRVAIVGRPNVGKSSLLNAVAGHELSLVDPAPGTTRDVVDTLIERDGRRYVLVDTAGMRRPSRIIADIERLSVNRSIQAVRRANVVVLLVEPEEGITDQDARIARLAWDEGRALVIVMNKSDLFAPGIARDRVREENRGRYPTLSPATFGFMSVTRGEGIDACFRAIDRAWDAHRLEVRTVVVNRILAEAAERRQPPIVARGRLKLLYGSQTATRPPTFTIFANREQVPSDYVRFLDRCFRESLSLEGTPLRLRFRRRSSHGDRG